MARRADAAPVESEVVADPTAPRHVIDHALAKRAALTAMRGAAFRSSPDLDDYEADPYLLRTAKNHGEPTERRCPVCRKVDLVHVTYVFGDELGYLSGRVRATAELPAIGRAQGIVSVYVVEVCPGCRWNHLHLSYVLGDGRPRRPPVRPRDLLD